MSIQVTKSSYNIDPSTECIVRILQNIGIETQNTDFIMNTKSSNNTLLLLSEKSCKLIYSHEKFYIPVLVLLGIYKYNTRKTFFDIELEEFCPYGLYCPYKTNPLKCPLNHHEMPMKLLKGTCIPTLLCRYELYNKTGYKMICNNPYCWYNHAKGRANRIFKGYYHHY
jgi:hypothetical protein